MNGNEGMAHIEPVRLSAKSELKFECHKKLSCFTKCCRGISIILTPYDIIRIKNRLKLTSEQFLAIYTIPELLEKTDIPVITLKLMEDEEKSCPFVKEDGCIIYEDRPTTCRYYPIGVGSLSAEKESEKDIPKNIPKNIDDGFYFLIKEPHCKGFEEEKVCTISEWRKEQGVYDYDKINAGWTELVVKKRSFPKNIKLTENAKNMFFMVSYNIDKFKEFVFESSFLKRYILNETVIKEIKNDETALLKFGLKWLNQILFKDGKESKENSDFKVNQDILIKK